jgi:hypothetical protein
MKKLIIILLAISIIFSFISCSKGEKNDTEDLACKPPYTVYDINEFLQYISKSQETLITNSISQNGASNYYSIPIPKIINKDYQFVLAQDNRDEWAFAFASNDYAPSEDVFKGIWIVISKNLDTFDVLVNQLDMTVADNYAFSEKHNTLLIEINNRRIQILSKDTSVVIDSPEKLSEYFVFEDYIIGSNNSNVVIE